MKEGYGSFWVEEDYTWRDDIMTVTRRIINEIDDARFSNIADHFDVDLSEIREFLDAKRRKHLTPITNADKLRAMSDEELAEFYGNDVDACPPGRDSGKCTDELYAHGEEPYPSVKQCMECWLDWLRQEAPHDQP